MPRFSLFRFAFVLAIGLCLIGGSMLPSLAQDEVTTSEEGTPLSEQETPASGWLQLSAVSCDAGGDPGTVSILLARRSIADKIIPTQGIHPNENMMPNKNDHKYPVFKLRVILSLFSMFKKGILNSPT